MTEMTEAPNAQAELEAWKEVHAHLSKAILVAKEGVAVAKAQRRYWMEEVCANLTPEGKLINTSTWKKTGRAARKTGGKRKQSDKPSAAKRRKPSSQDTGNRNNWPQNHPIPIMPNTVGMPIAQLYGGNQPNINVNENQPSSMMTPMQAAQSTGAPAGFPPAGPFLGKVLPPTFGMAPFASAQAPALTTSPIVPSAAVPNVQPLGAYASVLQGGDDSDTASDDDE